MKRLVSTAALMLLYMGRYVNAQSSPTASPTVVQTLSPDQTHENYIFENGQIQHLNSGNAGSGFSFADFQFTTEVKPQLSSDPHDTTDGWVVETRYAKCRSAAELYGESSSPADCSTTAVTLTKDANGMRTFDNTLDFIKDREGSCSDIVWSDGASGDASLSWTVSYNAVKRITTADNTDGGFVYEHSCTEHEYQLTFSNNMEATATFTGTDSLVNSVSQVRVLSSDITQDGCANTNEYRIHYTVLMTLDVEHSDGITGYKPYSARPMDQQCHYDALGAPVDAVGLTPLTANSYMFSGKTGCKEITSANDCTAFQSCETDPDPIVSDESRYTTVTSGSCSSNNYQDIYTQAECELAAPFFGDTDGISTESSSIFPGGCYLLSGSSVKLNTVAAGSASTTHPKICIVPDGQVVPDTYFKVTSGENCEAAGTGISSLSTWEECRDAGQFLAPGSNFGGHANFNDRPQYCHIMSGNVATYNHEATGISCSATYPCICKYVPTITPQFGDAIGGFGITVQFQRGSDTNAITGDIDISIKHNECVYTTEDTKSFQAAMDVYRVNRELNSFEPVDYASGSTVSVNEDIYLVMFTDTDIYDAVTGLQITDLTVDENGDATQGFTIYDPTGCQTCSTTGCTGDDVAPLGSFPKYLQTLDKYYAPTEYVWKHIKPNGRTGNLVAKMQATLQAYCPGGRRLKGARALTQNGEQNNGLTATVVGPELSLVVQSTQPIVFSDAANIISLEFNAKRQMLLDCSKYFLHKNMSIQCTDIKRTSMQSNDVVVTLTGSPAQMSEALKLMMQQAEHFLKYGNVALSSSKIVSLVYRPDLPTPTHMPQQEKKTGLSDSDIIAVVFGSVAVFTFISIFMYCACFSQNKYARLS